MEGKMNTPRKTIQDEMNTILKAPRIYAVTIIILGGLVWLLFNNVIYKTRLESANSIIQSKTESIDKLKADYSQLLKMKDTIRIRDTITVSGKSERQVTKLKASPSVQVTGNNAVVSQNQSGGITTGAVNVGIPPRLNEEILILRIGNGINIYK
jgi:hypothetical protein